jgi:hypothetical protein
MQTRIFSVLLCCIISIFSCAISTDSNDVIESEHFEYILYDDLNFTDITEISNALENNYARIVGDLQIQKMPQITIKIWADYQNFLTAMETDIGVKYNGATGYIFGMAEFRLFYTARASLDAVHEFAHLVSMQVNSTISNNPRWLWEAVALYESNDFIDPKTLPYMVSGNYPTLSELNNDYNSRNNYIYSVGYLLIEYIINTWGMDSVIALIMNNGNISNALGVTTQEFESGWHEFVEEHYLQ